MNYAKSYIVDVSKDSNEQIIKNTKVYIEKFFEEPVRTLSILKECQNEGYLQNFKMDFKKAIKVWNLMYNHILTTHKSKGQWLFIHYDQAASPEGISRIEHFAEANVDRSFPDTSLKRSNSDADMGAEARETYKSLCQLANYPG